MFEFPCFFHNTVTNTNIVVAAQFENIVFQHCNSSILLTNAAHFENMVF